VKKTEVPTLPKNQVAAEVITTISEFLKQPNPCRLNEYLTLKIQYLQQSLWLF
jgi:hypothetical protein